MGSGHAESGRVAVAASAWRHGRPKAWLWMNVNGLRSDAEMSLVSCVFCFFLVTDNWKSNLRVNNI